MVSLIDKLLYICLYPPLPPPLLPQPPGTPFLTTLFLTKYFFLSFTHVHAHTYDTAEGALDVGACVRYRLPGEPPSAPERRGVIMGAFPDYKFDVLLDPRDHIPVIMSSENTGGFHMRTRSILDYKSVRSEQRVQRFWNPAVSMAVRVHARETAVHLADSENSGALKIVGDIEVIFARNREGVKKVEVKSDSQESRHAGNLELRLIFPGDDRVEHTLVQQLPLKVNFNETVLTGGTHSHYSPMSLPAANSSGKTAGSSGPYLHRQGAILVGDLHITCGLNHIEAIIAIIDDNVESTSNPPSASVAADPTAELNGEQTWLHMVGRVPEQLPLDLGIEVLAREMGGHDIVIDTVFMLLTERIRIIVVSERYNHSTQTMLLQPMIRLRLAHPVLKLTMQHNSNSIHIGLSFADDDRARSTPAHLRKGVSVYFYNLHVLCWEPVLEPWRFTADLRLRSNGGENDGKNTKSGALNDKISWGTDVSVRSSFDLNLNASYAFFEMIDSWWTSNLSGFVQRMNTQMTNKVRTKSKNSRLMNSGNAVASPLASDGTSTKLSTSSNVALESVVQSAQATPEIARASVAKESKESEGSSFDGPLHTSSGDSAMAVSTTSTNLVYQHVVHNDTGLPLSFTVNGGELSNIGAGKNIAVAPGTTAVYEISEMKVEERWYENPWIGRDIPSLCVTFDCGAWSPVGNIPVEKGTNLFPLEALHTGAGVHEDSESSAPSPEGAQYESTSLLCDTVLENGRLVCRLASLVKISNQCDVPIELLLCGGSIPSVEMTPLAPKACVSLPIHMTHKRVCVRPLTSDIRALSTNDTATPQIRSNNSQNSRDLASTLEYQWWAGFDIQEYVSLGYSAPATTCIQLPRMMSSEKIDSPPSESAAESKATSASSFLAGSTLESNASQNHLPACWFMHMRWNQMSAGAGDTHGSGATRSRKKMLPYFTVTFAPPAVVTNLLPSPLYLKVGSHDDDSRTTTSKENDEQEILTTQNTSSSVLVIKPAASLYLYSKPKSELSGLTVALSMDRRRWSQFVPLQESAASLEKTGLAREKARRKRKVKEHLDFKAVEDRQITLFRPHTSKPIPFRVSLANVERTTGLMGEGNTKVGTKRGGLDNFSAATRCLEVFCRYWLVNQTQMVMKLRGKKKSNKHLDVTFRFVPQKLKLNAVMAHELNRDATGRLLDDHDAVAAPVMYSGSDNVYLSVGAQASTGASENEAAFSEWCTQDFDMSTLGTVQGVVKCRESRSAAMSRTLGINNRLQMHELAQQKLRAPQMSRMASKINTWFSSSSPKQKSGRDPRATSSPSSRSAALPSSLSEGISQGEYTMGVQMSAAPAPFSRTRLVVFTPHIVIVNKCGRSSMQVMQTPEYASPTGPLKSACSSDTRLSSALLTPLDDGVSASGWGVAIAPQLSLLPDTGQPFHWLDASVPSERRMIAIRPYEQEERNNKEMETGPYLSPLERSAWRWSGAIKANQVGDIAVSVRNDASGERRCFRVSNVSEGATLFVVISDESIELPLYRLVNDSQEVLHFRQCLRSLSSSATAATAKAEKSQKVFQSPNAKGSSPFVGSSPSLLRQRSVSKVGRLLPGQDTVFGWDEPHVSASAKDVTPRLAITVFTPSAPKGALVYIDEVGSESKFILPPSRHLGKNSHRMLFASTRVRGPTKTVIFSEMPPDGQGSASLNMMHQPRKGVQAQRLDTENAVAQERSEATAKARSQTQASLTKSMSSSSSADERSSFQNRNLRTSPKRNQKETAKDVSVRSITFGLHRVSVSLISDHAQELLLASISNIVFVHNTWPAASVKDHSRIVSKHQKTDETIELSVGDFQLDNMLDGAVNEVLLASTGRLASKSRGAAHSSKGGSTQAETQTQPFMQVSIIKPFVSPDIDFFSYVSILIQEFEVTADRSILDNHALVALRIAELIEHRTEMRRQDTTRLSANVHRQTQSGSNDEHDAAMLKQISVGAADAVASATRQATNAINDATPTHLEVAAIGETMRMSGKASQSFVSHMYGARAGMSVVGVSVASSTVVCLADAGNGNTNIVGRSFSIQQSHVGILPSGFLRNALTMHGIAQHSETVSATASGTNAAASDERGHVLASSAASSAFHRKSSRRLYVQLLHLHPLKFRLSYHHSTIKRALFGDLSTVASTVMKGGSSKSDATKAHIQAQEDYNLSVAGSRDSLRTLLNSTFASTAGVFFIDVDSDLHLKGLVHQDVFTDWNVLSSILQKHYFREIQNQILSVTGAANSLLGDPVRLITGLGGGARDFFYLPASGLIKSPKEFGRGVAKGSYSLIFKGVLGGTTNTLAKVTGSMSRGVATLSLDSEYLAERAVARRTERVNNIGNGLYFGAKRLGLGIAQGVTGIVTQPVKGAMREGTKGFIKGMARGVVGVLVKPTVGVTDFLSSATAGTTAGIDGAFGPSIRKAVRVRLPRLMYGNLRLLKVYNEEEANVRALMLSVHLKNRGESRSNRRKRHCLQEWTQGRLKYPTM